MLIGYARVSTVDQNLALQRDALTEAGCQKIFTEQESGAVADRPDVPAGPISAYAGAAGAITVATTLLHQLQCSAR